MYFIILLILGSSTQLVKKKLWTNPKPSSIHYCRPVMLLFDKENPSIVKQTFNEIDNEIKNIQSEYINFKGSELKIKYSMYCTMIDGAVAKVLTDTNAGSKCFICQAKPSEMNKVNVEKTPNENNYKFGLSPLQC